MKKMAIALALLLASGFGSLSCAADQAVHAHEHAGKAGAATKAAATSGHASDTRQLVKYPDALRVHTLANMRDHLSTMGEIQEALSKGSFDRVSELSEQRLGMSSLDLHGAHEVAKYMPKGMQDAGSAMHRSASQLAIAAKDASVTGDLKPVLASLARLSTTCVACHAAYRLQ